ncbi:hypothetical protein cypCar_00026307 [Cyprinus carpio]|nr:hypothetical protein cypCar_00026307 [Cyprinus carpio]
MGTQQDLLLAVKNGDLPLAHKLLAKIKTNRNSALARMFLLRIFLAVSLITLLLFIFVTLHSGTCILKVHSGFIFLFLWKDIKYVLIPEAPRDYNFFESLMKNRKIPSGAYRGGT